MSEVNIPPGRVCDMLEVERLTFPSREGLSSQQDEVDLQVICSGRRRICAFLNSPSPCASSAMCHIQDMRSLKEKLFQKPQKNHPETDPDPDLYVEGISISASGYQRSPLQKKLNDVLSEVVYLVERLEADRQSAEEELQKEKRTRKTLESKVDSISLRKLIEHPSIVQKEHEACSRDIAELKWHLKLENKKVTQVQKKLLQAELLNQNLQEDVEFARNQIPVVRDNLDRQKDILNQIDTAQAEADDVYTKTKSHLLQAQKELREIEGEAKKEKTSLDHKRVKIKSQLSEKLQDLNQLKILEKSLLADIKDTEESITLAGNKCTDIILRIPEILESEKMEEDRILQLSLEIENEMQKNRQLKEKQTSKQEEIDRKKPTWEAEVSFTEELLHSKHEALAALHKENQEYEQEVEDYKMKICDSEKAVKQMREERKQMLQKITDNDEQWEKAKEEVTQVVAQHSVIQAELEEQEQLTFMEEQTARTHIENLRKDLTANMTTLEVIKGQCSNVNDELKKQRASSELINRQLRKEFDESSSATQALDTKVKQMKKLIDKFEKMQFEYKKTLINLKKENKLKSEELKAAQDLHTATLQRIDNAIARYTHLTNESEEYQKSSDGVEKNVETLTKVIAELEKDFHVVDFKNKSAASFMSTLQSDINNCQQRTQRFMTIRTAHLKARKEVLAENMEALDAALAENKHLANKYEDLQRALLEAKENSVSVLSEENRVHERFNYYTELSLLQKRMHKVLVKYLEQRSLQSQAELDRCQAVSQQTAEEIKSAQQALSEEIEHIAAFLQSFGDRSTTTKTAEKNKQPSPDADGVNE